MKKLVAFFLLLSGCGTAQLVSTREGPPKRGTVKLDIPGPAATGSAHEMGEKIMKRFCAPDDYHVVGTDSVSEIGGAYASPFVRGAVNYDYKESPLIHFECLASPQSNNGG